MFNFFYPSQVRETTLPELSYHRHKAAWHVLQMSPSIVYCGVGTCLLCNLLVDTVAL